MADSDSRSLGIPEMTPSSEGLHICMLYEGLLRNSKGGFDGVVLGLAVNHVNDTSAIGVNDDPVRILIYTDQLSSLPSSREDTDLQRHECGVELCGRQCGNLAIEVNVEEFEKDREGWRGCEKFMLSGLFLWCE